jgi:hypothetical protein
LTGRSLQRSLLLLIFGFVLLSATGARGAGVEYQTWVDYNARWKTKSGLTFFGDAGLRRNYVDPRWWKFILRPSVGYEFDRWTLAGGIGNIYSDLDGVLHIYELRPWQGARVTWPLAPVPLTHLFRLEERFFFDTDDGNSLFRLRLRYRLGTRLDWTGSESGRGWYSPLSVEAFFQFDKNDEESFGEQARVTAGIARAFNPSLRVEFDLLWQKTARYLDLYSDNELFLRLRVFQYF